MKIDNFSPGKKFYKCNHCGYSSLYNVHLKHTQWKYSCNIAGSLKTHMRTHSAEKSFHCKQCEYSCKSIKPQDTHVAMRCVEWVPLILLQWVACLYILCCYWGPMWSEKVGLVIPIAWSHHIRICTACSVCNSWYTQNQKWQFFKHVWFELSMMVTMLMWS